MCTRVFVGMGVKWLQGRSFPKPDENGKVRAGLQLDHSALIFPFFLVFWIPALHEATSLMITRKTNNITCHQCPWGGQYLWDSLFNLPCFPAALWPRTELGNLKTCSWLPSSWRCFCIRLEEHEMKTTLIFFFPFPIYHSSAVWVTLILWLPRATWQLWKCLCFSSGSVWMKKMLKPAVVEASLSIRYCAKGLHTQRLICSAYI